MLEMYTCVTHYVCARFSVMSASFELDTCGYGLRFRGIQDSEFEEILKFSERERDREL